MGKLRLLFSVVVVFSLLAGTALAAAQSGQASKSHSASKASKSKSAAKKSAKSKSAARKAKLRKKGKTISRKRARRVQRAFKASSDLKPMAQQLVQMRTPEAYAAVEKYARKHAGTDAGSLAWLALGYSRLLDRDYAKATAALQKARNHAGELADYVRYLQAQAHAGAGQPEQVLATLKDFQRNSQDSIFLRDAALLHANALTAVGRADEALQFLQEHRTPTRADVELALGRAYMRAGETEKGMSILRHLYLTMPASSEAAQAATEMQAQGSALAASFEERRRRAELLGDARRWSDAAREYRALLAEAPEAERGNLQVALAAALKKSGNSSEARSLFESAAATGEAHAQRLYHMGEFARSDGDEEAVKANLDLMRQHTTASAWLDQALLSAGNMYLLRKDYDRAIDMYREIDHRFPNSPRASYAHWKSAWLSFRQNRVPEAKNAFERQVQQHPSGSEVPAALYWRARLAEEEGDLETARAWYVKCAQRFRNYYYGLISRERLAQLKGPVNVAAVTYPLLDAIPEPKPLSGEAAVTEPPSDNLAAEKSKLLVNAGLTDFAIKELQAVEGGSGANWATLQIARIHEDAGQHHRAVQFLKRAVPSYYSLEIAELPRAYWDLLFPTPYWTDLQRFAEDNSLDPYLVASLIRQESEFNPKALSHANAWGLMQLLPTVGRGEARELRLRGFSTDSLVDPKINMQLGTRYFREMIEHYNGQVEYALAAYNAGSNRVDDWLANGKFRDVPEFVETIPFTETREYVQAIMRNAQVYKALYQQNTSQLR